MESLSKAGQEMSLAALKQNDPYITSIADVTGQVALYSFSPKANEWVSGSSGEGRGEPGGGGEPPCREVPPPSKVSLWRHVAQRLSRAWPPRRKRARVNPRPVQALLPTPLERGACLPAASPPPAAQQRPPGSERAQLAPFSGTRPLVPFPRGQVSYSSSFSSSVPQNSAV